MKTNELGWGFKSDDIEAPAMWGARAIFTGRRVDFLWDRQEVISDKTAAGEKTRAVLILALNGKGGKGGAIEAFERAIDSGKVEVADEGPPSQLVVKGVRFFFSERGSHGYLYVTAILQG